MDDKELEALVLDLKAQGKSQAVIDSVIDQWDDDAAPAWAPPRRSADSGAWPQLSAQDNGKVSRPPIDAAAPKPARGPFASLGIDQVSDEEWAGMSRRDRALGLVEAAGKGLTGLFLPPGQSADPVDHPISTLATSVIPAGVATGVRSGAPAIRAGAAKAAEYVEKPLVGGAIGAVEGYSRGGMKGAIYGGVLGAAGGGVVNRTIKQLRPTPPPAATVKPPPTFSEQMGLNAEGAAAARGATRTQTMGTPGFVSAPDRVHPGTTVPPVRAEAAPAQVGDPYMPNRPADTSSSFAPAAPVQTPGFVVDQFMPNKSGAVSPELEAMRRRRAGPVEPEPVIPDAPVVDQHMPNRPADNSGPIPVAPGEARGMPQGPVVDPHMPNSPAESSAYADAPPVQTPGFVVDRYSPNTPGDHTPPVKPPVEPPTPPPVEPPPVTPPPGDGPPFAGSKSKATAAKFSKNDLTVYNKAIRDGMSDEDAIAHTLAERAKRAAVNYEAAKTAAAAKKTGQ